MRVNVSYGAGTLDLELDPARWIETSRGKGATTVENPAREATNALEHPLAFPALRQAIVPGDHVVIVADSDLPHAGEILGSIVEYLADANVAAENILVLEASTTESTTPSRLLEQVPPGARHRRHVSTDRSQLSYLASTRAGARVYLNREVVDADLVLLVGRVDFDPILGYRGTASSVFPGVADEDARKQFRGRIGLPQSHKTQSAARQATDEVAWLLGVQFAVQVVVGIDGELLAVLAGNLRDVQQQAQNTLLNYWRRTVARRADLVIAGITSAPELQGFAQLGAALESARQLVTEGGRVVVLSSIQATPGVCLQSAVKLQDPAKTMQHVQRHPQDDAVSTWLIANCCQHARVYLYSRLSNQLVEELSMTPIASASEVQRLLDQAASYIVLPDAQCVHVVPCDSAHR